MGVFFGLEACVNLAPWPGIKPILSTLEGEVLTRRPPGKSLGFLKNFWNMRFCVTLSELWLSDELFLHENNWAYLCTKHTAHWVSLKEHIVFRVCLFVSLIHSDNSFDQYI